ncbi:MAG: 50S ribosomal protein L11 methyltransferase [Oscillospiraceae bacterium]|jgi:ribosomal protein L11 methyltransferase
MDWIEVSISTTHDEIDSLAEKLTIAGYTGLQIEDEADFDAFLENNRSCWDYVDDELIAATRGLSRIKLYLSDEKELPRLNSLCAGYNIETAVIKSEDWENNYKKYYKPIAAGEKLLILPLWEPLPEGNTRKVLRLDPGVSFGTGSHATTRLCLELMEKAGLRGGSVLDLGCGSGILAIASLLLGAETALGCDIDPLSADTAAKNAAENGFYPPKCSFICGNALTDEGLKSRFEAEKSVLVLANIVADVIIPLSGFVRRFIAPGGAFICSGIISHRAGEVESALKQNGFFIKEKRMEEDWAAFLAIPEKR